jgi:chemotaxis response regulator CheB
MPEISPNPIPKIRVLIADDHPVIRYGLCTILQSEKDLQIVGEAVDGEEACALCRKHCPDVLVLDLRMPKKGGLQVLSELTACGVSKPHTLVITAHVTEQDIHQAQWLARTHRPDRRGVAFRVLRSIGCRREQTVCWSGV